MPLKIARSNAKVFADRREEARSLPGLLSFELDVPVIEKTFCEFDAHVLSSDFLCIQHMGTGWRDMFTC